MAKMSRARAAREARRAAQFRKFKLTELNLVPLVDTFVSIVFFALTTATVGELIPVMPGVTLPDSRIGASALQQVTLGIGSQIMLGTQPIMNTADAAAAQSEMPGQPLEIPQLYAVLKTRADSLRQAKGTPASDPVAQPLAIQGDRTMRYDLLSRVMQTARLAGFKNISLEVKRDQGAAAAPTSLPVSPASTPAPAPAGAPNG
jgi:biopolymer transport protein ExbD